MPPTTYLLDPAQFDALMWGGGLLILVQTAALVSSWRRGRG